MEGQEEHDGDRDEDMHGLGEAEHLIEDRTPILNLRLVNPAPLMLTGKSSRPMLARGRSATKHVQVGEEERRIGPGLGLGPGPRIIPPPPPKPDSEDVISPTSTVMPTAIAPQGTHDVADGDAQSFDSRPASAKSFKFQEI